jgi:hypothetical protein
MTDNNKIELLNKILTRRNIKFILILGIGFIVSVGIFSIIFGDMEVPILCYPDKDVKNIVGSITPITEKEFLEHPALAELAIQHKRVYVSHGLIFDTFFWLNPFSYIHSVSSSGNRVSSDEEKILTSQYSVFNYNGTIYRIVRPQCAC